MKKAIGGYFELELNDFGTIFHDNAIALNSARNAFEYILRIRNIKKVYIPYYICDVILQPINKLGTKYEFYQINKYLEPVKEFDLRSDEYLLYVNYYGIKNQFIRTLSKKYKNLIIDNSQAFFSFPEKYVDTFYSPRKFFGIPDGGFLYTNFEKSCKLELETDNSYQRCSHLLKRIDLGAERGYQDFKKNNKPLDNQPIKKMSNLTKKLLANINFEDAIRKRNESFVRLHNLLGSSNEFSPVIDRGKLNGPMVYPYFSQKKFLREYLIKNKIYVATYWENVLKWVDKESIEHKLVKCLLPLPIDQRYEVEEIDMMSNVLTRYI